MVPLAGVELATFALRMLKQFNLYVLIDIYQFA